MVFDNFKRWSLMNINLVMVTQNEYISCIFQIVEHKATTSANVVEFIYTVSCLCTYRLHRVVSLYISSTSRGVKTLVEVLIIL